MNTRKLVALMLAVSFVGSAVAGCRNGRCGRRRPAQAGRKTCRMINGRKVCTVQPVRKPVAQPAPVKKTVETVVQTIASVKAFDKIVAEKNNVIVKFSATWCAPCKEFAPTFETSAKANTDVAFVSVDIEAVSELADRFEITSVPAVVFIKDGEVAKTTSGLMTAQELDECIKEVYAQA